MADQEQQMDGGLGETMEATSEVQELCDQVKLEVEEKCGKTFGQFVAVSYRSQLVAGTNYFIKVDAGDGFIHVRIYQPLPQANKPPSVTAVQQDKSKEDEIVYFEG
uniref:Cystatin domain-containing protein n=1 Tax=Leptobrachium leishanense TaxID=445787 RepID=A0A8C5M5Q7_9ANUR